MENTQHTPQTDADSAQLLQQNPPAASEAPMYAPVGIEPADASPDPDADTDADSFMLFPPSVWD